MSDGPVTTDRIRYVAENPRLHPALAGIKETESKWMLGPMSVSKRKAQGGTSWESAFDSTTAFRKDWFEFPDIDKRGWAIIFRNYTHRDRLGELPIEYVAGWVPPDRAARADEWIAFMNGEIQKRLAEHGGLERVPAPDDPGLSSPDALRHQLRLEHEPLAGIQEQGSQLVLGRVAIEKGAPVWELEGQWSHFIEDDACFRTQRFHYPDAALRGTAVIFYERTWRTQRREHLAGWVPPARETDAEEWVALLNREVDRTRAGQREKSTKEANERATADLRRVIKGLTSSLDEDVALLRDKVRTAIERAGTGPARLAVEFLSRWILPVAIAAPEQIALDLRALAPIVERAVAEEQARLSSEGQISFGLMDLLDLANALECVGCALDPSSWDLMRGWLPRLRVKRNDARAHYYWNAGFGAFALDERRTYERIGAIDSRRPVEFVAGETFEFNMQGLLRHLASAVESRARLDDVLPAWNDLLCRFALLRDSHSIDLGTLLWIARIVFHRIGGAALGEVARRFHDTAWALAGVEA